VLLKVIALGLKRFPRFNASLDMSRQQIILKDYIHIGLAVATDRGLLVPVIRDVVNKSISELAVEMEDVVDRARRKKLPPDEMEGGTFTLSNQGGIGGVAFTPIVYWPQAAILGVSRATVAPRYRDGDWQPRTILPLCLSYDHRINDGADAAGFLRWIGNALAYPMELHL
jgi:pyruvate dehydrogenase E2 component (dihydrolipoamide acetyltransferase)